MKRICCATFMGLFFTAVIAPPVCVQAANSWDYIKVLSGPGNVNGAIANINRSWVQLKFKWSSPCPSPRTLIITARGNNTDLASKRFGDLWPVGEVGFLLPPASDTVTVVMTNGPCEANSEVQIFATKTAGVAISDQIPAKEQEKVHQALKNEPKPKKPKPIKSPLPSACLAAGPEGSAGSICIVGLRWDSDLSYAGPGFTMFLFGTLENRLRYAIDDIDLSFPLQNSSGAFVRTLSTNINAPIPPGGRWDFKIYVGQRGTFQLVEGDVVLTQSATVRITALQKHATDTFHFEPVFDSFEGRAKKRWMQAHP